MIAILPLRKNSRRLLNKNIKKINQKPLYNYILNTLLKSKEIKKIVITTDYNLKVNNKKYKMTKKILKGTVTSAKNNKTIVVQVTRKFKHPFYEKVIKRSKKYHAHDEKNKFKEGENVSIVETKPYSKKKTWKVME